MAHDMAVGLASMAAVYGMRAEYAGVAGSSSVKGHRLTLKPAFESSSSNFSVTRWKAGAGSSALTRGHASFNLHRPASGSEMSELPAHTVRHVNRSRSPRVTALHSIRFVCSRLTSAYT
jgi:hypothetical protein